MAGAKLANRAECGIRKVEAELNYIRPSQIKPRYHANDTSGDTIVLDPRKVFIEDARTWPSQPSFEGEGFQLVPHVSGIADFHDPDQVTRLYPTEIAALLLDLTGADYVGLASPGLAGAGLIRATERSPNFGRVESAGSARRRASGSRLVHIDPSEATAKFLAKNALPKHIDRPVRRACSFNVWRVLTPPPQDKPLTVCVADSFSQSDLCPADTVFDTEEKPWFSVESLLMHYNPNCRWAYFSDMTIDEVLVFKANDSDPSRTHNVPHTSFDDPSCPADAPGRESIEIRGCAYWFD